MWHKVMRMQRDRWVRRAVGMWAHSSCQWKQKHWRYTRALKQPATWSNTVAKDMEETGLYTYSIGVLQQTPALRWKEVVKEALFIRCIQPRWRKEMQKKDWLSDYSATTQDVSYETRHYSVTTRDGEQTAVEVRKKQKTFCMFLKWSHRRLRQFHLVLRAGSLPLQQPKQSHLDYYRCGGQQVQDTCFMCTAGKAETLEHFMNECPGYQRTKDASKWWKGPISLKDVYAAPGAHGPHVQLLFDMWSARIQSWRKSLESQEGRRNQVFL